MLSMTSDIMLMKLKFNIIALFQNAERWKHTLQVTHAVPARTANCHHRKLVPNTYYVSMEELEWRNVRGDKRLTTRKTFATGHTKFCAVIMKCAPNKMASSLIKTIATSLSIARMEYLT